MALTTDPIERALDKDLSKRLENIARRTGALLAARDALDHAVTLARQEGATWAEVGMAADMTKQAAQQRWGGH